LGDAGVAHGAEGMLHFAGARRGAARKEYWYGVLDHDNIPPRAFEEFKQKARVAEIGPQIVGSRVVSEIAAIKDFERSGCSITKFLTKELNVARSINALFQAASEQRHNIDFRQPGHRPDWL